MTDQVNEAVAWVVPSVHVAPDGSYEDGPDSLVLESEATDYIRRIGTPLYAHPSRGVVDEIDPNSRNFIQGMAVGRAELEIVRKVIGSRQCDECGARNPAEAQTMCRPDGDSCPGTEWPLANLWELQAALPAVPAFDMLAHLQRQREWSGRTFGPGPRTAGVIDHIRKELREIEADPTDLSEWIDVVILALDGAWRAGGTPEQIIAALVAKQTKNEGRTWPDWRTSDPDKAIEHDRAQDAQPTQTDDRCSGCGRHSCNGECMHGD